MRQAFVLSIIFFFAGCEGDDPNAHSCESTCDDGLDWTSDSCSTGQCDHIPVDCGGMRFQTSILTYYETGETSDCMFWSGFGNNPEVRFTLRLSELVQTNGWYEAPTGSCAVECGIAYDGEIEDEVSVLVISIEWNGEARKLEHREYAGVMVGTWDGQNILFW